LHAAPPRSKLQSPKGRGAQAPGPEEVLQAEGLVRARVHACGALLRAIRSVVQILSSAGRGLERSAAGIRSDAAFRRCLAAGGPPTARVGCDVLEACQGLGATLVGLATVMASEFVDPLQDMQQSIRKDCADHQTDVDRLEQQEQACSAAVRESAERKDRASWALQVALEENEKLQSALPSFLHRLTSVKLESQVQHAAGVQKAAVDDLAASMDQAALARLQKEQALASFQELLSSVDGRCVSLLLGSIQRCAGAWDKAGQALRETARRLQSDAASKSHGHDGPDAVAGPTASWDAGLAEDAGPSSVGSLEASVGGLEQALQEASELVASGAASGRDAEVPEALAIGGGGDLALDATAAGHTEHEGACAAEAGPGAGELPSAELAEACPTEAAGQPPRVAAAADRPAAGQQPANAEEPTAAAAAEPPLCEAWEKPPAAQTPRATVEAAAGTTEVAAASMMLEPLEIVVQFDEEVKRLGFEVLWEEERPVVGNVMSDGAAQRSGMSPGDVLTQIGGLDTLGRSRDELMPLLKVRPLELKMTRAAAATPSSL